jgi:hypothetical protein
MSATPSVVTADVPPPRPHGVLVATLLGFAAFMPVAPACAQVGGVVVPAAPAVEARAVDVPEPAEDDEEEPEPGGGQVEPNVVRFNVDESNLDQWVFNNNGMSNGAQGARSRLESQLAVRVDEVDRVCGLSDAQKKKLLLAGRGDVKRFFDRVEEARKLLRLVKNDQQKFQEFYSKVVQPLRSSLTTGLFHESSLFAKTLARTVDESQARHYGDLRREHRAFRYRADVELAVRMIDDAVGLKAEQRQKLIEAILKETRPPRHNGGSYFYQALLYRVAKIDKTIRPIFNDDQWKTFSHQLDQARRLEQYLRQNGFLDDDEAPNVEKK